MLLIVFLWFISVSNGFHTESVDPKLDHEMKKNGLFYELDGTVAFSVEECENILLGFRSLVNGGHFESAANETRRMLAATPALHTDTMLQVLNSEYEIQLDKHLEDMEDILAKYLAAVPRIRVINDDLPRQQK